MENKSGNRVKELRNIRLMLAGIIVSKTGTMAFTFALAIYILRTTGSAMGLAISIILYSLPKLIISPYAGVLADRIDRKLLVVGGDLISGLVVLLLLFQSTVSITSLYAVIVVLSLVQTFFEIAFQAAQPDIVSDDGLFKLNSYAQSAMSAADIIGPALGGIMLNFGIETIILVNGLSFIMSGLSESFIDFTFNRKKVAKTEKPVKGSMRSEYKEAFQFIRSKKIIVYIIGLSLGINMLIGLGIRVPLPYLMNEILKMNSVTIGLIEAILSIGILVSSLILGKRGPGPLYKSTYLYACVIGLSVLFMGLPFAFGLTYPELTAAIILAVTHFTVGFALPSFTVPIITFEQQIIPENMRGRVFGLIGMLASIGMPLMVVISAFVMPIFSATSMLVFVGAGIVVLTSFIMSRKQIRLTFKEVDASSETSTEEITS
ncbi:MULTISPECIES: MFS transporter [unclassified Fusibacter]|uniref:MFS transporter n=1 Tax=unclassified Fusibacter TaxID=2624464 RepID=UPI001010BF80|nr:MULTISPECIES: MFS transporter [unclassified Fusibacter]MCK8060897.1 MFS transporter [Fusibacter sp. A2]NPE23193.1 MFS transporter [Fusibacter sp. A1]RXV59551.1 MFS transporter [Fusibacter sp. A1]